MKRAWSSWRGVDPCGQAAVGKEQPDRSSESSAGGGVLTVSPEASGDAGKVGSGFTAKPVGAQGVG